MTYINPSLFICKGRKQSRRQTREKEEEKEKEEKAQETQAHCKGRTGT